MTIKRTMRGDEDMHKSVFLQQILRFRFSILQKLKELLFLKGIPLML